MSTTSSDVDGHPELLTVHRTVTLVPAVCPVMVVVRDDGVVIVAPFEAPTNVQAPVPGAGSLADIVKFELLHRS